MPTTPKMATPEDQAWMDEFMKHHITPQPCFGPTVQEMAEVRIRAIDKQMRELQLERERCQRRLEGK